MLFHLIPDSFCITRTNGVYRQRKLYRSTCDNNTEYIYAEHGNGFISLYKHGTSLPKTQLVNIDIINVLFKYNNWERLQIIKEGT